MKKASLFLSVLFLGVMMLASCGGNDATKENEENKETSAETNEPSNEVTIGKQVWMNKNLDVDVFQNGDKIPEAKTDEEWKNAAKNREPAWCYYNNNPDNGDRYGKLYNWYAVNDSRGLAPEGWKIPSDEDWTRLSDFLGSDIGKKMKFIDYWSENGNGKNESGFAALPSGYRSSYGDFLQINNKAYFWSSTEDPENGSITQYILTRMLSSNSNVLSSNIYERLEKGNGAVVRCIRK